jgi:hypothetical protein
MTGDIVNLKQFRKQKARDQRKVEAEANRHKFGRTKGERTGQDFAREKLVKELDQHRLPENPDDSK